MSGDGDVYDRLSQEIRATTERLFAELREASQPLLRQLQGTHSALFTEVAEVARAFKEMPARNRKALRILAMNISATARARQLARRTVYLRLNEAGIRNVEARRRKANIKPPST